MAASATFPSIAVIRFQDGTPNASAPRWRWVDLAHDVPVAEAAE